MEESENTNPKSHFYYFIFYQILPNTDTAHLLKNVGRKNRAEPLFTKNNKTSFELPCSHDPNSNKPRQKTFNKCTIAGF